ncbi:hypothetical protein VSR34_30160 [Paraburkholderia sp. JHI2823]|uniref:hypothetical protein n=1 Tax=Paraburkholderia sp. JHI2823 TaxID=3112960 RepID=UPI00317B7DF7
MSGELLNGLIGSVLGSVIGKILGRFRLWKVFVVCFFSIYLTIFLIGALYVGPKQAFFELRQFVQARALLIFAGISGGATLVAFLGRTTKTAFNDVGENSAGVASECRHDLGDNRGRSKNS